MKIPNNRTDFERHMNLLSEGLRQRTHIISHRNPHYMRSLHAVHAVPNRRLNMLSINETARLAANSAVGRPDILKKMQHDQQQKGI
jgi:hypothetical protein